MTELEEALLKRIDKLVNVLEVKKAPELWDNNHIAAWFGIDESACAQRVTCRPGFPKPVHPTGARHGKKVYFADEVIEWARLNRSAA